ncbi:putative transcription factor interactor and regulator CCHC(Zn) family [Helianthus annuus]|nr:putative transcription factor interactor and regulator CCHC(Zn) family [Helianthus annuus]
MVRFIARQDGLEILCAYAEKHYRACKVDCHELELKKTYKVNHSSYQQNLDLYYPKSMMPKATSPKTAFTAENVSTSSKESQSGQSSGNHSGSSSSASHSDAKNRFQCNIAIDLKNAQNFDEESAKQQMIFLASVLESYEGLVAGKIGNTNLTKEDYDQIDPEEMELIDIHWVVASAVRRAQRFMEITGRKTIGGPSTKLGFDKSKVTCFKCKQKGHFKRECRNTYADESENRFRDDYYKKAIYHQNKFEPPRLKQVEDNKEKSRALAVIYDDEGYDWSNEALPEEDAVGYAFMAKTMNLFLGKITELKSRSIDTEKCWLKTESLEFLVSIWKRGEREDGIRTGSVILIHMEILRSMTKCLISKP